MVRIAKQTSPVKLQELKMQINDFQYLQIAIDRIARGLTDEIVKQTGVKNDYRL